MEDVLVPILFFAFVFGIPITAIIMESRDKRSRDRVIEKAIESGADLDQVLRALPEKARRRRRRPYRRGLTLIAIGAALLVVRQVSLVPDSAAYAGGLPGMGPQTSEAAFGFLIGGTITLFLGVAMVLADLLNRASDAPRRPDEDSRG